MSKNILIFFGPPGSGKGTQAKMLAEKFKSPVAATGELLRLEIKNKTKLGEKLKKFLHSGRLVPDTAVKNIIIKRLKNKDARNGFILDGYPRNLSQLKELSKILKKDIVTVLVMSPKLVDKSNPEGAIAVTWGMSGENIVSTGSNKTSYSGGGRVLHVMSHFGKQRSQIDEFALQNLLLNCLIELNQRRPKSKK
jgi:hypothetical protein